MSRKYVLIPLLVTLAVLAVSLYPTETVNLRASAAPRSAVVAKYLMIPSAAFSVTEDGYDYFNLGAAVYLQSGGGSFVAPVYLPPGARIRSIKLFAYDTRANFNLCAVLYETHPKYGSQIQRGEVCTTGTIGNQQPMKYLSHYVKWYYGYYIRLNIMASTNLKTYAVMLKYTINQ
jgi:hypothetical protein